MSRRAALLLSATLVAFGLGAMPGMASANPASPHIPAGVHADFSGNDIAARLIQGDDPGITAWERSAVDKFVNDEATAGTVVTPQDVRVGTVTAGPIDVVAVVPDNYPGVPAVSIATDDAGTAIGAAAQSSDLEGPARATQAGPGMGYWPTWDNSKHSTVALELYVNGGYYGEGRFQTYKRQYLDDGNSIIDSYQVSRDGLGTPASGSNARVAELWASEDLTDASYAHAREWLSNRTNPEAGWTNCQSNVTFSVGPFSFGVHDCAEYSVWTGRVGHYRMNYDQGSLVGNGSREIGYVAGWTMDDGKAANNTWYEFITLTNAYYADYGYHFKCTSNARGTWYQTDYMSCYFTT